MSINDMNETNDYEMNYLSDKGIKIKNSEYTHEYPSINDCLMDLMSQGMMTISNVADVVSQNDTNSMIDKLKEVLDGK